MPFVAGAALSGRVQKLYIDVDGDIATPTWVEFGKIQGASISGPRDVTEIKERDLQDTIVLPGHISREISLTITRRPGNTSYDAVRAAHNAGTKIGVAMMTGPIAEVGQTGFQCEAYCIDWNDDQAHDNGAIECTLRPAADYVTPPAFVTIIV